MAAGFLCIAFAIAYKTCHRWYIPDLPVDAINAVRPRRNTREYIGGEYILW